MSRKRTPYAEIGAEDYRIVRHTHDTELATKLMHELLITEGYCSKDEPFEPSDPRPVYIRIVPCLPGTWGDAEGWAFEYQESWKGPGAFPAVVFR